MAKQSQKSKLTARETALPAYKTALEKAGYRNFKNFALGYTLTTEAQKEKLYDSVFIGDCLAELANPNTGNFVAFQNFKDKKDRCFEAPHAFVCAPTRLDNAYARKQSYRTRSDIEAHTKTILEKQKEGYRAWFITPTIPNPKGLHYDEALDFLAEVWKKFRDSDYYKINIEGAFKKIETTCGKFEERRKNDKRFSIYTHGYHPHNHLFALSNLDFADCSLSDTAMNKAENKEFAEAYTKSYKAAYFDRFKKRKRLKKGTVVVDIRPVKPDVDGAKGIFYELSKYLAKSNDYLQLPPKELLRAQRAIKNRKLISTTGIFNECKGKPAKLATAKRLDKHRTSERASFDTKKGINSKLFDLCLLPKRKQESKKTVTKLLTFKQLEKICIELHHADRRQDWLKILRENLKKRVARAKNSFLIRHPYAIVTNLNGMESYGAEVEKLRPKICESYNEILERVTRPVEKPPPLSDAAQTQTARPSRVTVWQSEFIFSDTHQSKT